jgi:hypothetical protein
MEKGAKTLRLRGKRISAGGFNAPLILGFGEGERKENVMELSHKWTAYRQKDSGE